MASPGSMHETGCSGPVHWDDPEGWDGEGHGRGVQDGEHRYTHGGFMSMYGETHYNIVIKINKILKSIHLIYHYSPRTSKSVQYLTENLINTCLIFFK